MDYNTVIGIYTGKIYDSVHSLHPFIYESQINNAL